MGRMIDADDYLAKERPRGITDGVWKESHVYKSITNAPTVEAIPKTEMRKMLRDCADKVSDNILDIVRKDYIHKADYEARLKADMVAMLEDLRLDFQEAELAGVLDNRELIFADEVDDLVQQRINELDGEHDPTPQI